MLVESEPSNASCGIICYNGSSTKIIVIWRNVFNFFVSSHIYPDKRAPKGVIVGSMKYEHGICIRHYQDSNSQPVPPQELADSFRPQWNSWNSWPSCHYSYCHDDFSRRFMLIRKTGKCGIHLRNYDRLFQLVPFAVLPSLSMSQTRRGGLSDYIIIFSFAHKYSIRDFINIRAHIIKLSKKYLVILSNS